MAGSNKEKKSGSDIWNMVKEKLNNEGIDIEALGGLGAKVVCVASDLRDSVEEMGQQSRDQTVMVRVDEETSRNLDEWVETGYVKSRSEAAALFIREGLKVRSQELDKLRDALHEVEKAKKNLRERANEIFGDDKA